VHELLTEGTRGWTRKREERNGRENKERNMVTTNVHLNVQFVGKIIQRVWNFIIRMGRRKVILESQDKWVISVLVGFLKR